MKNVHILPTDKPSRFFLNKVNGKLLLDSDTYCNLIKILPSGNYQNIYITSDEEIKEGDKIYHPSLGIGEAKIEYGVLCFFITRDTITNKGSFTSPLENNFPESKKIILTTDQDLINDGVQAVDDEFLQWFVKNPSCEEIEIFNAVGYTQTLYFIVIPKEKPKQETLEEAAENKYGLSDKYWKDRIGFVHGAKWQAERMYSEEEVKQIIEATLIEYSDFVLADIQEWFEQFKKEII